MAEEDLSKEDEQEKYRNLQYRMNPNEFPKVNELVYVSNNFYYIYFKYKIV